MTAFMIDAATLLGLAAAPGLHSIGEEPQIAFRVSNANVSER